MPIQLARINKIENYIPGRLARANWRVALMAEHILPEKAFPLAAYEQNDVFLPPVVGPATEFNAEGKSGPIKELPKVRTYINTVVTTRSEFAGRYHRRQVEKSVDIYRKCYQKRVTPPPNEELRLTLSNGNLYIISDAIQNGDYARVKHIANVFLEVFGVCDIVGEGELPPPIRLRRKNWQFLPEGNSPRERVDAYLPRALENAEEFERPIIEDRQRTLVEMGADEVAVGLGGFKDYLAFIFSEKGLVVLEALCRDNALYVFNRDWEPFSQLSKRDIINQELYLERIIHSTGWKRRLRILLDKH
jgi:hypothetical protein